MAGYVRTHRDALEHPVFQDDWLWRLFSWCILKANWRPARFRGVDLEPGQFVTGRIRASEELHVSPSKWYRGMQKLESPEYGCIKVQANSEWTIVTVVNWQTYQCDDEQERTASEQQVNSERTASEQRADTIEKEQTLKTLSCSTDVEGVRKSAEKKRKPFSYAPDFEQFWLAYPRKIAKGAAARAFEVAIKKIRDQHECDRAEAAEFLTACAREFADAKRGTEERFIVYPERWLGKCQWDDATGGNAA